MIPALTGIRGLAVLWVFAFHANALLAGGLQGPPASWGQGLAEKGLLGVQLFFVLSGFLLARPWIEAAAEGRRPPAPAAFYARRAWRILPAYWLHLALLFGLILPLLTGGFWLLREPIGQLNLALHPLLLQFAHPGSSASLGINMALWSLTIEAQFYLLLPLLAPLFCGRRAWLVLVVALALSLVWKAEIAAPLAAWLQPRLAPETLIYFDPLSGQAQPFALPLLEVFIARQLPGEFLAFALGMAAANLHHRLSQCPAWGLRLRPLLESTSLALLVLMPLLLAPLPFAQVAGAEPWRSIGMPFFLLACTLLVLAAAQHGPLLRWVLGNPLWTGLGAVSFSLYLWHEPAIRLAAPWTYGLSLSAALALCLGLALLLAIISYALAEGGWRRWRRPGRVQSAQISLPSADPRRTSEPWNS